MITVKTQFAYADDSTRLYSFDCENSLAAGVKNRVIDVNDSLSNGTAGGLSSFFVSDDGENLVRISGVTLESAYIEPLTIAPNS